MVTIDALDERRHPAGPEPLWNESYYLDWFAPDGSVGGFVRMGFLPNQNRVWFWSCIVGPDRPLVIVVDHDIEMPTSEGSREIRGNGLWAEVNVEEPREHVTANAESFALVLDDPRSMFDPEPRGERVPFGFELDWFTDRAGYMWPPLTPRYEIPCRVTGQVMVGSDVVAVDGWGQRDHSWGASRDWWSNTWCWSAGRFDDATRFHTASNFSAEIASGVSYVLDATSATFATTDDVVATARFDRDGFASDVSLLIGGPIGRDVQVEPVAWAPIGIRHHDGRLARFCRALARVDDADGRGGWGWVEWNHPGDPVASMGDPRRPPGATNSFG